MDFFSKDVSPEKMGQRKDIRPLADRMRPRTFDQFFGQEKVIGPGTPLRKAIEADRVTSLLFWGPPGTGKTTLAEMMARSTEAQFVPFSAVSSTIKEVREVISRSRNYYQLSGRRTYIFIDEIHRFNKAQQDAFLPSVEKGDIILIGATTENPSFEVISALLSRLRVYVLERLSDAALSQIVNHALTDSEQGLGSHNTMLGENSLNLIVASADGDARRALTLLDEVATFVDGRDTITVEDLNAVFQRRLTVYDKGGEEHYNIISALHKAMRGGDPDASLYWLARMFEAGEDPMYIVRRVVRFASEDIGLADSFGLTLALNARDSYHFLGSPEGELAIAQAVVYLACAPKSNSIYTAFKKAMTDANEKGSLPTPLWIRNAPTSLMKGLGYGKGYQYAHDYEDALTDQEYFPEELSGTEYFHPKESGREARIAEYLTKYRQYRRQLKDSKSE